MNTLLSNVPNRQARYVWLTISLVFCLLALANPLAFAKHKQSQKQNEAVLDAQTESLLRTLSQKPELMNLDYLEHIIGRPENEFSQSGLSQKHHYWYDNQHQVKYQLDKTEQTLGAVTEATFYVHLPNSQITAESLKKTFGEPLNHFYDFSGNPTEMYSLSPNTQLLFTTPHGAFHIGKAEVVYRGPPLAMPAESDLQAVRATYAQRVLTAAQAGQWNEVITILNTRLQTYPNDGGAHAALGDAYFHTGDLNAAILHYKAGLALTNDPNIHAQCIAGLQALKVIPPPGGAQPAVMPDTTPKKKKKKSWSSFFNGNAND